MKFFVGIGCVIIVLLLALTLPAYAETQSVKISGDITIRGVYRKDFDLDKNRNPGTEEFIMTTTEVQIDAELTDNVSTVVRIVNQRNWGDSDRKELTSSTANAAATHNIAWGHGLLDLGIDLAYVQIKELIFEPVSVRIGRQDLWFGRGLLIGANQTDPGFISATIAGVFLGSEHGIGSPELTAFNSFDAVRATIDFEKYAPFVVDLVYFKNDEGAIDGGGDVDVYGVNAAYTWDVYNAETEAYYWLQHSDSIGNAYVGYGDETHTIGARGSFQPNEDFIFGGEAAYQFGQYIASTAQTVERTRSAYMFDAFVEYLGWTKYMYSPKVGAEWLFTSGDRDRDHPGSTYNGWNPLYRGYYPLLIRPFQGYYYTTSRFRGNEDLGLTNQHEFILSGSMKPLDDITFEAKVARYYFDEVPLIGGQNQQGGHWAGDEVDLLTTYDYTEDVTFSLLTAWYFPGKMYRHRGDNATNYPIGVDIQKGIASEVIGSCKVSF